MSPLTNAINLTAAFGLVWKATLVLLAAQALAWALGRSRPALGAAVGHAGLVGLLILPLALILPPMRLSLLPGPVVTEDLAVVTPRVEDLHIALAGADPVLPIDILTLPEGKQAAPGLPRWAPTGGSVRPAESTMIFSGPGWVAVGLYVYTIVAGLLLVRLAAGLVEVARLRRRSVAVDEAAWWEILERLRVRLGLNRKVELGWSEGVSVPVAVGWRRPAILLPPSVARLGESEGGHPAAILLHELAHLRRGDYAWNLVQRLVEIVYWPHPLVWMLGRVLAELRERACDNLCVYELGGPSAYRETLLVVASGMIRRPSPALGLAMSRTGGSKLGRRLAAIEHSDGSEQCLPRWPVRAAIAALTVFMTGLVGMARLTPAEARPAALGEPPKAGAANPSAKEAGQGRVLHLQVVSATTGTPVPKANVRIWIAFDSAWKTTDDQGRIDIPHSTSAADRTLDVDAWGDGFAMQRHDWGYKLGEAIPDSATIKLHPGETLGGVVNDEQGKPVAGAAVYLWSHNYKKKNPGDILFDLRAITGPDGRWKTSGAPETTGELLGFHIDHPAYASDRDYVKGRTIPKIADLRAGKAVSVMKAGLPIEGRVVDADGKPVAGARVYSTNQRENLYTEYADFIVTSGPDGRFRTGQVDAGEWFLLVRAKGHAPGEQRVNVRKGVSPVEIALGRPRTFRARVVDPDGKPIEGVFVNIEMWRSYRCLGVFLYTDAAGRVRWDDAPEDNLRLNAIRTGYLGVYQQPAPANGEEITLTLRPSLSISGKVQDAETGKKIANATVEYSEVDAKTGEVSSGWRSLSTNERSVLVYEGQLGISIPATADAYKLRILAEGFEPFVSRAFRRQENAVDDYDVKLIPLKLGAGPVATALRPDGKPLVGARVYRAVLNESNLGVEDGQVRSDNGSGREVRTGTDGTFPMPPVDKPSMVLILADDCYAYASREALIASPRVLAKPYGRVEGHYMIGSRPAANMPIELVGVLQDRTTQMCRVSLRHKLTTDAEGRFTFEKVIPGYDLRVARRDRVEGPRRNRSLGFPVSVEPGETARVTLGGNGRPVVGVVEPPRDWKGPLDFTDRSTVTIVRDQSASQYPPHLFRGKTSLQGGEWSAWAQRWRESPEGRAQLAAEVFMSLPLAADGSFRFDDVPPGEYRLSIGVNEENRPDHERGPFARLVYPFTVPRIPRGWTDRPLRLAELRLQPRVTLQVGQPAPGFEITTIEGKKLAVPGDLKGKVVLLDFGTLWDTQSRLQIARLNGVREQHGKDGRLVLLSLVCAPENEATRIFIAEKGQPWLQAVIGPLSNPIASAYGVDDETVAMAIVIGPDGTIVAKDLHYDGIGEAVAKALVEE